MHMQAWGCSKQTVHPYDLQDLHVGAPAFISLGDNMCCHALLRYFFVLNGRSCTGTSTAVAAYTRPNQYVSQPIKSTVYIVSS